MTHETDDRPSQTRSDGRKRRAIVVRTSHPEKTCGMALIDDLTKKIRHYDKRMNELGVEIKQAKHEGDLAEANRLNGELRVARAKCLAFSECRKAVRKAYGLQGTLKRGR